MQLTDETGVIRPFSLTLLLVAAEPAERALYREYLAADAGHSYQFWEAEGAIAALALCQKHPVGAVLWVDPLADGTGIEFLQALQTQRGSSYPPVVIVAQTETQAEAQTDVVAIAVRAIKLGAEDYLISKDLTPEKLQTVMQRAMQSGRSRQQTHLFLHNQILDQTHDSVITTDLTGIITSWNQGAERLLGYTAAEAIGQHVEFLYPVETRYVLAEQVIAPLKAKGTHEVEVTAQHRSGARIELLMSLSLLRDEAQTPIGMIGFSMDISKRKRVEEQLRLFIKHVPAGVAMLDQEMRYIWVSDRWLASYGLGGQDIIGRCHYDIFPEVPERWQEIHRRCLAGAIEACDADPFPRLDGHIDWVRWEIRPWRMNNHQIGGIVIFSEIITERVQAEAQLREREATIRRQLAELETIYATAPVGLACQDRELRYVRINDRLAAINGVPAADHLGRMTREVLPELANTVEVWHRHVLTTGEAVLNQEVHGTTKANPEVARDWIASYCPLKDENGQVVGVNMVVQEVTELKQLQAERERLLLQLEQERRFLAQILQQMPLGVTIAEAPSGQLLFHNEEATRLLRHPMRDSETHLYYAQYGALHPDGQPYSAADYPLARAVLAGEVVKGEEMRYRRGDGTETIFSVSAAPIVDSSGHRIAAVSVFEDIAEQKRLAQEREQLFTEAQDARKEAEAANRSKDEFIALVAHELRSPLNAILGWARLLQSRQLDEPTQERALETIARNAHSQAQLVEDLLDVSRVIRGTLQLESAPVDLAEVIQAAVETVRPTAEMRQLSLTLQLQAGLAIAGDFHRLQQVILNLLTNALKFTPEGGQVHLQLDNDQGQARIQVQDTGKGISPELLPHVFERFHQDPDRTTAKQGLGLGLAIAKNLIERHGGTVSVASPGVGQGTQFTILLPLLPKPAIAEPLDASPDPSDAEALPLAGMRVLVVDDEPDILTLTAFILEEYGAIVATAENARTALETLQSFRPQLLLCDIAMPEQNGYDLLRQMRTLPEGQIPAIALTAYVGQFHPEDSSRAGFQQHLTKPVDPDRLISTLLTHFNSSQTVASKRD